MSNMEDLHEFFFKKYNDLVINSNLPSAEGAAVNR